MVRPHHVVIVLLIFFSAACSSTAPLVTEPTQKLIIPTVTDTLIPLTPTITSTPLPRASDLSTVTPEVDEQSTTTSAGPTLDDPVAAELVGLAQRRVAE